MAARTITGSFKATRWDMGHVKFLMLSKIIPLSVK